MIALAANTFASAHGWTAGVADLSRSATGSLVAAAWQGVLLAAAAGLGLRLLPKTPAAVRFAIWFGVFLIVAVLPMVPLPHAVGGAAGSGRAAWLTLDGRWSLGVAAVWMLVSLVRAGTLVAAALRVRALWKRATPVEFEGMDILRPTHRDKAAMNGAPERGWLGRIGQRRVRLCTSNEVDRPTVIGFFSPKILIPEWLLQKLTPAELEQIVLHEAGHLGRADDWMNLLQKVALVVFPLNPALAWVERRLCFERELACDERVLHATSAPRAYAACLAALAEYRVGHRGLALALGAVGRESELGRRVSRILQRGERMKPMHAKLVLGGAMLGLVAAAAGLERCPQLVGFAARGGESVAHGEQWRPTHGGETAMNESIRPALINISHGVISHGAININEIQPSANVTHDGLRKAATSTPSSPEVAISELANARSPLNPVEGAPLKMVPTSSYSSRTGPMSVSDVKPSRPAEGVMQWVVVTSWEDAEGSRMVLTTAVSTDTPAQAPAAEPESGQVHPYAAVPVRGGWLVFQL
jgi:BlaR1 peptidase M56